MLATADRSPSFAFAVHGTEIAFIRSPVALQPAAGLNGEAKGRGDAGTTVPGSDQSASVVE